VCAQAHLSRDDFRIFDQATGRVVAVSHHYGKNPYESLDPLGVGHNPNQYNMLGEMESLCNVTGIRRVGGACTSALSIPLTHIANQNIKKNLKLGMPR